FLIFFLFCFLIFAYKNNFKILFALFISIIFFSWPAFVAYPNPRYINAVYPILSFMFVYGMYLFSKKNIAKILKNSVLFAFILLILLSIKLGLYRNYYGIKNNSQNSLIYKTKFEKFFSKNKFDKNANFIVFGIPFVSDIRYVFQIFLKDLNLRVAYIRHSTLAEFGCMGCQADCKIIGVKSLVKQVKENNRIGFRLISLDEDHCGWWINFSNFPLKWSEKEKAYVWSNKEPELNVWHKYSMGDFKINRRSKLGHITDVTYLIDNKWIDENTVFITWDSWLGKYKTIRLYTN
ncbi:hypothetical protein KJ644_02460, partial [Candidatus Dependentiae bacterium]|nr:hypothetical protein [Candidatus Dependentiae bacterium]